MKKIFDLKIRSTEKKKRRSYFNLLIWFSNASPREPNNETLGRDSCKSSPCSATACTIGREKENEVQNVGGDIITTQDIRKT